MFEEGVNVLLNFQKLRSTLRSTAFPISSKANALSTTNKRPETRTSKTLEVRHFMFCRRLEDFACFRRCERLRHNALLLAVAIITCSLKSARALAEASRDGVFLLAHAKRMAFRMLRGSCVRSSFRSSRGRRSTADHRSLRRRPRRVMQ